MTKITPPDLQKIQEKLGYKFNDPALLDLALTEMLNNARDVSLLHDLKKMNILGAAMRAILEKKYPEKAKVGARTQAVQYLLDQDGQTMQDLCAWLAELFDKIEGVKRPITLAKVNLLVSAVAKDSNITQATVSRDKEDGTPNNVTFIVGNLFPELSEDPEILNRKIDHMAKLKSFCADHGLSEPILRIEKTTNALTAATPFHAIIEVSSMSGRPWNHMETSQAGTDEAAMTGAANKMLKALKEKCATRIVT